MSGAGHVVIWTTTADKPAAEKIALDLVKRGLAACAQITRVETIYRLDDETQMLPEFRLALQTRAALYPRVEAAIRALHDLEAPPILMQEIAAGAEDYLAWIDDATAAPED